MRVGIITVDTYHVLYPRATRNIRQGIYISGAIFIYISVAVFLYPVLYLRNYTRAGGEGENCELRGERSPPRRPRRPRRRPNNCAVFAVNPSL